MLSKKQIIILIILTLILIGGIFLYWQQYGKWPWQKEISMASPTATVSATGSISQTPAPIDLRGKIMNDAAGKIAQLSPAEPVLGGQWFVDRFWYVKGSDVDLYVEYEDGHILRMILLKAAAKGNGFEYKVEAYFEPGESDWILQSGQDTQTGRDLELYEFDQAAGQWVRKN